MGPNHFKRELVISFSIIGGSIIVFGIVLYFLSKDLTSRANKLTVDRLFISQRAATIAALASLKTDAPKADMYLQAMSKFLVSQDQLFDFPRWLDGIARSRQVGMNFSFQGSQTPPQGDMPGFISFSLDLSGELSNLVDFLKDIEFKSTRFLVAIDNFDLRRSDSGYRILANGKVFFK